MQRPKTLWFKVLLPLLALLLTACPNPAPFDISLNPTSLTITQGGSGTTQLTITPKNGFSGTVNLSLVNSPAGVSLSSSSVEVGGSEASETLTISTTADTPVGRHTLTLEATSGSNRKTAKLTLTVKQAPTLTVNTTDDTIDADPGDGTCADSNGNCSLRAAVMEANALEVPVVINIPAGTYKLTRTSNADEQGGDLDIKSNVTLKGAGAGQTILDGNGADRVLHIHKGATVRVEGVTIQNGKADDGKADDGGGILNVGTLTLTNSTVSGNTASDSGGGIVNAGTLILTNSTVSGNTASDGGGIVNGGTLTLTNSTVSGNTAGDSGGGIVNIGTLTLKDSTVSGNTAKDGGGIVSYEGTLTITNSIVSGNSANGPLSGGGGIKNSGTLTITNSIVSGNSANGFLSDGGGIFNYEGTLILTDSTVSGNTANWRGGGIYNSGTLTLTSSTMSGNTAGSGGGVYVYGSSSTAKLSFSTLTLNQALAGGGIYNDSGTVELKGVILAGNTSKNGPECSGSLTSRGYNLIGNSAGCSFTAQATDITGQDPLLGELKENGGPTKTHLPQANGPVLDKVPTGDCTDLEGNPLTADQRGVSRPQGAGCDIGAVERRPSE